MSLREDARYEMHFYPHLVEHVLSGHRSYLHSSNLYLGANFRRSFKILQEEAQGSVGNAFSWGSSQRPATACEDDLRGLIAQLQR